MYGIVLFLVVWYFISGGGCGGGMVKVDRRGVLYKFIFKRREYFCPMSLCVSVAWTRVIFSLTEKSPSLSLSQVLSEQRG